MPPMQAAVRAVLNDAVELWEVQQPSGLAVGPVLDRCGSREAQAARP